MRNLKRLIVVLPLLIGGALSWYAMREVGRPLSGPQPVAWDHEPCAHCRMLVSEPAFAAQLVEPERALHFDDPGCLFAYLGSAPPTGELWFHDSRGGRDRWLSGDQVGFVPAATSPMGYGLAAVDAGAQGAISLEEARRQATARSER